MYEVKNLIDNMGIASLSDRVVAIYNPATGEEIGTLRLSTENEVHDAIASAKKAYPSWSATPPAKRAKVFFRYAQLLNEHKDAIANEISREHGKTHDDALGEVARALEVVEFACGIPQMLKGEFSRNVGPSIDTHSERQSLGVVAGITPFNFPGMVPMWMFPMAIACGNTFVLKPSERDPSAAIFTRDGDSARKFSDTIEVGMVGVNVPIPVPVAYHSFGGWKRSSFGAHGIYGPEAVHFYTRLKTTTLRWPEGISSGAVFTFPS